MKEIYSEIEVNASAAIVWDILTNFDDFPNWNPFIKKISGKPKEGSQLEIFLKPPNSSGMTFKPTIIECIPGEKLRWLGKLWIPKLFDGEHSFIIKKLDENRILFIQKESFSGILVPLLSALIGDTINGFEMMNQALKKKVET
jgi:hypothetical protein